MWCCCCCYRRRRRRRSRRPCRRFIVGFTPTFHTRLSCVVRYCCCCFCCCSCCYCLLLLLLFFFLLLLMLLLLLWWWSSSESQFSVLRPETRTHDCVGELQERWAWRRRANHETYAFHTWVSYTISHPTFHTTFQRVRFIPMKPGRREGCMKRGLVLAHTHISIRSLDL